MGVWSSLLSLVLYPKDPVSPTHTTHSLVILYLSSPSSSVVLTINIFSSSSGVSLVGVGVGVGGGEGRGWGSDSSRQWRPWAKHNGQCTGVHSLHSGEKQCGWWVEQSTISTLQSRIGNAHASPTCAVYWSLHQIRPASCIMTRKA